MLATGIRIGEVLAPSGNDVTKNDDSNPAVWINADIIRVTGQGIVRVPGRKGNKPGLLLTVPPTVRLARRRLAGPVQHHQPPARSARQDRVRLVKTVATLLDEAGLNVGEIADQLGNTRAVTERHYIKKAFH